MVEVDKNHRQLPFSMVFIDLDTYLVDISNLEISCPTLSSFKIESGEINEWKTGQE